MKKLWKGLIKCVLLTTGSVAYADVFEAKMTLFEGEAEVIQATPVERIAIGDTERLASTVLATGEVVLTALSSGETTVSVWFKDGSYEEVMVNVLPSNQTRERQELTYLLKKIPGLSIEEIGRNIVVDGVIDTRDLERVNLLKDEYPEILVLAREKSEFEQKMIFFEVRVAEVSRDLTENLGINWSTSIPGPSLGYEKAWRANPLFTSPNSSNASPAIQDALIGSISAPVLLAGQAPATDTPNAAGQAALLSAAGGEFLYWGINTSLLSTLNLLEKTGGALTVSEPQLSSRSGGSANLTVGGEVPVVTTTANGPNVEYKDYGVILNVEPTLDRYDNISAEVNVEVSQLDLANSVGGFPAFSKRSTTNSVKLKPGETLALSGLFTREEQRTVEGIKWLQDIPVLGHFFKSRNFTSGNTEMIIFVTPRVVDENDRQASDELVERANEMVRDFENKTLELLD